MADVSVGNSDAMAHLTVTMVPMKKSAITVGVWPFDPQIKSMFGYFDVIYVTHTCITANKVTPFTFTLFKNICGNLLYMNLLLHVTVSGGFWCGKNKFQCVGKGVCIDASRFCDGVEDCDDKSDEPPQCDGIFPHEFTFDKTSQSFIIEKLYNTKYYAEKQNNNQFVLEQRFRFLFFFHRVQDEIYGVSLQT